MPVSPLSGAASAAVGTSTSARLNGNQEQDLALSGSIMFFISPGAMPSH